MQQSRGYPLNFSSKNMYSTGKTTMFSDLRWEAHGLRAPHRLTTLVACTQAVRLITVCSSDAASIGSRAHCTTSIERQAQVARFFIFFDGS